MPVNVPRYVPGVHVNCAQHSKRVQADHERTSRTMRLRIDTSGTRFIVTRAAEPRLNFETGSPKVDTATGVPLFATQVLALDDTGGEVLNVTVAGDPKVTVTQPVSVSGLVAIPWAQGDRSGVAFRADAISPTTPNGAGSIEQARPQK